MTRQRKRAVAARPGPRRRPRACDWPGCPGEGVHRAPRSPAALTTYFWFCLVHVRLYNRAWNYYAGMTDAEVEKDLRRDVVWNRPSWPLGQAGGGFRFAADGFGDPFGWPGTDEGEGERKAGRRSRASGTRPPAAAASVAQAMAVLDLEPPISAQRLKARYKELAKRHHPDTNGGDKASEEKIKKINQAYQMLRERLPI